MKYWVTVAIFSLTPVRVGGYLGEVITSFPSPALNPYSLAASSEYIFVLCDVKGLGVVYVIRQDNGSFVRKYPAPFGNYTQKCGYEYGGYLWVGREGFLPSLPAVIARCDAATGSILYSFPIYQHELAVGGLDCQGDPTRPGTMTAVISNDSWGFYGATRHKASGRFIDSFRYSIPGLGDCAWDYENELIWFTPEAATYVRGFTTAG